MFTVYEGGGRGNCYRMVQVLDSSIDDKVLLLISVLNFVDSLVCVCGSITLSPWCDVM